MSTGDRDTDTPAFDMTLEPTPQSSVIEAEEDEAAKRERDAALASTFDPERAHAGKSDEELIAEHGAETRELVDAAIALGIIVAVVEANDNDPTDPEADTADTPDGSGD